MKLTENSKMIMNFLSKKNCIPILKHSKNTDQILLKLYAEIKVAAEYLAAIKANKKFNDFYNVKITRINNISEIPKPRVYSDKAFPEKVRAHINENATYLIVYTFSLFQRHIHFKFIAEDDSIDENIGTYNKFVDMMLIWMYI